MKLSLAMIVKNGLEDLERLHPLIKDYVDEWVVVVPPKDPAIPFLKKIKAKVVVEDFTQPIEPEYIEQIAEYGLQLPKDYRLFNFAKARNESFKHCIGDYILWLDADDTPVGLKNIKEYLSGRQQIDIYDVLYDYAKDNEGNAISDHIRERIVKNTDRLEWRGAALGIIHETIVPKQYYRPTHLEVPRSVFRVEHDPEEGHDHKSALRNHIALLYEYLRTKGADARTTYYLGTSFFNMKDYGACIEVLQEYIKVSGWDEEKYRAWIRIAEAYHQINDKESSRNAYLNAIKELPNYPDAYLGLGESYHSDELHAKAIEHLLTGLQKPVPKTKSAIDMVKYAFRPLIFLALSNVKLGRSEEGYKWFIKAKKSNPKHPWVAKYEPLFVELKEHDEYIRSFVRLGQLSQKYYPKTLPQIAEIIPDEIKDQEVLLDFRRRYGATKVWGDKSIVIFASQAFEEWGPHSLETGCGGSEEAVIHLSRLWTEAGWEVTIYNNCPEETTVGGVVWKRYEKFNPRDDFNILISWRNNPYLEPKRAGKKFVDVHDVPNNNFYPAESVEGVTMMAKSQYHRSLFPQLLDENFQIVSNGIDLSQFPKTSKIENNLVWTSSYNRGLEYLLEMWADVKKEVPSATLDVAYGWNLWEVAPEAKTDKGRRWRAKMDKLLSQDGITHHGRLSSDEVAKLYLQADVWAYPTDFPEIDCITATKAMAAKCVPITTDFAVMKERNQGVMIKGDITKPEVKQEFQAKLIELLKDSQQKQSIRKKLDVAKFSWTNVAKQWDDLFRQPDLDEFPLVSIIIPTYNRPEMLARAVQSAINQTYPNKEIIVTDDGSSQEYALPSGVKFIQVAHSGKPAVPKNEAIRQATGQWHYFLDDDDEFWSRHSLMDMMKHTKQGDLIYSDTLLTTLGKETVMEHNFTNLANLKQNNELPGVYLLNAKYSERVLFDETLVAAEDYDRSIRLVEAGAKPYKVNQPHYRYHHHNKQIQYQRTQQQDESVKQIHDKYSSAQ